MFSAIPKLTLFKFKVKHKPFDFRSYSIEFELCGIPKISALLLLFDIHKNRINLFVIICKLDLINMYFKELFCE